MNKRNAKKKKLLLYFLLSLCLIILFIFLLIFFPPLSQIINLYSSHNCSPKQIRDVSVPELQLVAFSGSTTFASLNKDNPDSSGRNTLFTAIKKAHPQFKLQYIDPAQEGESPGSGTGIKWLIEDMHNLRFALSSRPITDKEFENAKNRTSIRQEKVAYDIMALYVNKELIEQGLNGLTIADVKGIFTGRITNWRQVKKGLNIQITPFVRDPKSSGTAEFFKKNVLNNQEFGSNKHLITEDPKEQITTIAIRDVASNPGGISFATASELINQKTIRIIPIAKQDKPQNFVSPCTDETCNAVDTSIIAKQSYPAELIRKLYVIIKQDGNTDQKAGEAYANILKSCEGQNFLKQAGFVPIE